MPVALFRSTHPLPSLAVTAVVAGLGLAAGLDAGRVALLALAMLLGQFSVGLSNDWIDAPRDRAVGRTDKPVAMGLVSARAAGSAAIGCLLASLGVSAALGVPALLANVVALVSAWGYNLGLKGTPLSVLPYITGFGVLPAFATLALVPPVAAAPWALATGAMLGVAAHFANVLPDLEDDAATGVRGLPHRLGWGGSAIVTYSALVVASIVGFAYAGMSRPLVGVPALALALSIAVAGVVLGRRAPRIHFRLIIAGALLTVGMLVTAGAQLLA